MNSMRTVLVATVMCCIAAGTAVAADRRVNGLLIGAGSGAIIGQATGQNTQSVLLGTAIGGAVGYAIGSSLDGTKKSYSHAHRPTTVVTHYREPNRWPRYRDNNYRYRNNHYHDKHDRYRSFSRDCVKTVKYEKKHGRVTRIVKTSCDSPYRPRPHWVEPSRRWYR